MDKVLSWYADYMGLDWYVDGQLKGKDLEYTGIPQNYGIRTREELLSYYIQQKKVKIAKNGQNMKEYKDINEPDALGFASIDSWKDAYRV